MKKWIEKLKLTKTLSTLTPILIAFLIGAVAIILAKESPFNTYYILISKSLFNIKGLLKTLHYAAPLILSGLAIAVSFKAGLFNMGIEGQIISSGFVVAMLGYRLASLPAGVLIPLLLLVGIIVGVIMAILPAFLKAKYNVNEMVVTLLLNYAIYSVLEYLTSNVAFFRDPSSGYVSTYVIGSNAIISRIGGSKLTIFFFIVMIVFVVMYFVMKRSKLGFEINAMGKNRSFSEATGMEIQKKTMYIMLLSGALAGLAGAGWMMAEKFSYTLDFSGTPGLGWDGMLIALLGGHTPIGILVAAIFYAALKTGASSVAIYTSVPAEIIILLQALIVLFLSIKFFSNKKTKKVKKEVKANGVSA
ncbi:ABC transporter permease [Candidatus Izemoplasma sp. B36]|uniref:ABC transporter permease n=1 Tax=Candidatus Izemoplasma sp. B36 TaxID=3242468 RepID=UPI003558DEAA